MILVLAEKPSVARELAKVLGANKRGEGFISGNGYIVTWAVGHLVEIAEPALQGEAWKGRWTLGSLPILPPKLKTVVTDKTKDQFAVIKRLMLSSEVEEIVAATDAGREGELIFRRIYSLAGCTKSVKRLWLSSMTVEAIGDAFAALRPGSQYDNLAYAAAARAAADWLVGMNFTRALSCKAGDLLSVGRVQTPVLAMLVQRRQEIEDFKPTPYWVIEAILAADGGTFKAFWHKSPALKEVRLHEELLAQAVIAKCQGQQGLLDSLVQKKGTRKSPLLYDLTTLQREANSKFGFSAQETLGLAQALYEQHKAITYPRTDSQYISADVFRELGGHLKAIAGHFPELAPKVQSRLASSHKFVCVNDKKVTDHHAIIPTNKAVELSHLKAPERQLFDLVCRRFLAAFLPDAQFLATTAWVAIAGEKFRAQGKVFKEQGWLAAEPWRLKEGKEGDEEEGALPPLAKGQVLQVDKLNSVGRQTKAPSHYTDASLLRAMELAGQQVEDEDLAEALKERGLGTPATRAATIETVIKRGYADRQKKAIVATDKGMEVCKAIMSLLPATTSPKLTGDWEQKLRLIERGDTTYKAFMVAVKDMVSQAVAAVKKASLDYQGQGRPPASAGKDTLGKCPMCGGDVVESPKAFGCANWKFNGCKFAIWKNAFGGNVTKDAATQLLTSGQTAGPLPFTSKDGKSYEANLRLAGGKAVLVMS
jgi:DNA topoisomerase-3